MKIQVVFFLFFATTGNVSAMWSAHLFWCPLIVMWECAERQMEPQRPTSAVLRHNLSLL